MPGVGFYSNQSNGEGEMEEEEEMEWSMGDENIEQERMGNVRNMQERNALPSMNRSMFSSSPSLIVGVVWLVVVVVSRRVVVADCSSDLLQVFGLLHDSLRQLLRTQRGHRHGGGGGEEGM